MRYFFFFILICLSACNDREKSSSPLFTNLASKSGIEFNNSLTYTERLNPYTYRNFYNGAGVAIGDLDNDGLEEVYFASNQGENKLFKNKGGFQFEDITSSAGVGCVGSWSTGVVFADVNADGYLDIYVCKSGDPNSPNRHNALFINNQDLTFTERAKEYGLDIIGLSVQAAFFDYDKDGDLDCYLLTNSFKPLGNFELVKEQRQVPDEMGGGNRFFINEGGYFRDHSLQSGIYRSSIGFGLGITLGDFNNDTWIDVFISNDFFERDYLYINNQKGAFTESLPNYFKSISMGSMGADFADLDNDGLADLFVTEMLPDSLARKKSKIVFESWNKYQFNLQQGYHHQFARNVLQKQVSPGSYLEVGRYAGVAASEWSWGALLFDMNSDGKRDIFVANGIYKDLLDRDYLTYTGSDKNVRALIQQEKKAIIKLVNSMPSSKFPNYAFENKGDLRFENKASGWGLGEPMYSSGSAYGDLDNDGDLDLVVNNVNAPSGVFQNQTDTSRFKNISFLITSQSDNTFSTGTHLKVYVGSRVFLSDNFVVRGYQSCVSNRVVIGLGENVTLIDSVVFSWPTGGYSKLVNVKPNQVIRIQKDNLRVLDFPQTGSPNSPLLRRNELVEFTHAANDINDFDRDRLLPMMYSNEMPSILKCDINKDGVDELYVGGGRGQSGRFIYLKPNTVIGIDMPGMKSFIASEETKSTFFDVDGDGDEDVYLAFGGRSYPKSSTNLLDVILLNDGTGKFSTSPHQLPFSEFPSTSVVKPIDFDNDGDLDLCVGERFDPFTYGVGGRGFLLQNDGDGKYKDVTEKYAPGLGKPGMVTDIEVQDIDHDGWKDLIVVGDWMPITFFKNVKGHFVNDKKMLGVGDSEGWWHEIESADLNGDGKIDFVVGNNGLNTFFKSGDRMYVNDFDQNGSIEQIFCTELNGRYYPLLDKDELLSQLPGLKKRLLYFKDYATKSMTDLFPREILEKSIIYHVNELRSVLLISDHGDYKKVPLPKEAQFSSIYAMRLVDVNNDGVIDLIAGGNQDKIKPQFGPNNASSGWLFLGRLKNGFFEFEKGVDLGVGGEIRSIEYIEQKGKLYILFAKYGDKMEVFEVQR
jgi:enediyne biosynthesis protein E4